jgi:hypothetical protein
LAASWIVVYQFELAERSRRFSFYRLNSR